MSGLDARASALVSAVVAQALRDSGAGGVILLDDGSTQAAVAARWLEPALGTGRFMTVGAEPDDEPDDDEPDGDEVVAWRLRQEALRARARRAAARDSWLTAHAATRTTLLLTRVPPPEPILPLGDLYAHEIVELAGDVALPPDVAELARRAGGIPALDHALARLLDRREAPADALLDLDPPLRDVLRRRLRAGRFWRPRLGLVPKLGPRTIGVDLLP